MWTEIINTAVKLVIMIAVTVITGYFIPWIKANLNYKQIAIIQSIATSSVQAAEQMFAHGENNDKLEYATTMLDDTLKKYGITLTVTQIRGFIEDCVNDLKK